MTTAEFIIGHSADDADERKQEMRKAFWALLIALAIHLVIGYSLAVYGGLLYSPFSTVEDKPVELSFVDLPTPAPTKNTMFVPVDESKQTEPPKDKTFESSVSSTAASEQPATGGMPLPSQQGSERTKLDLDSRQATLETQGAQAQPSVAPQQSATPQPTVQPTPKSDELAMLTSTPRPTVQPTVASTPQQQRSSYQPYKEKTRLAGAITNRGMSAVNALGTPLGRYQKSVYDAIGSHWNAYTQQKGDLASFGTVRTTFVIDRNGHVQNLKIISNDANEALADISLQSILDSKFDPIPEEIVSSLPPEGLEQEISFISFPR